MSTRNRRLPIWTRPEPGTRRPRFSRADIAAVAMRVADTEGIDAVSMRRVASELGAGTMTLYHYVRTKEDLLALMDDAMMAELLVPESELPKDWREALTAIAHRTRNTFSRHRWALLGLREPMPGPNGMRHFEQSLQAVAGLEVSLAAKQEILLVIDDFVFGHVMRTLSRYQSADIEAEALEALREFGSAQLATGDYPNIATMVEEAGGVAFPSPETETYRFEAGLAIILDGIARRFGLD